MEIMKSIMNILMSTELGVPLFQIILLLFFSTFSLLFGKTKLALIINYLFTFYWGYIFNKELLVITFRNDPYAFDFIYFYFAFGFIIVILFIISMLLTDSKKKDKIITNF